jgi:hypothetical protein
MASAECSRSNSTQHVAILTMCPVISGAGHGGRAHSMVRDHGELMIWEVVQERESSHPETFVHDEAVAVTLSG